VSVKKWLQRWALVGIAVPLLIFAIYPLTDDSILFYLFCPSMFFRWAFPDPGMSAYNLFLDLIVVFTNAAFYICLGFGAWPVWEHLHLRKNKSSEPLRH
jgi:hypothetical protein